MTMLIPPRLVSVRCSALTLSSSFVCIFSAFLQSPIIPSCPCQYTLSPHPHERSIVTYSRITFLCNIVYAIESSAELGYQEKSAALQQTQNISHKQRTFLLGLVATMLLILFLGLIFKKSVYFV